MTGSDGACSGIRARGRPAARPDAWQRAGQQAVAPLVLAFVLVVAAVVLWIGPSAGGRVLLFEPSPLGGRFVGCWATFLAVMAAWVAFRPAEAKLPLLALTAYPAGALVAGLRSLADLEPPAAQWA